MPANTDFARFNFQVPTMGSASAAETAGAVPIAQSAAKNTPKSVLFMDVVLLPVSRLQRLASVRQGWPFRPAPYAACGQIMLVAGSRVDYTKVLAKINSR